MRMDSIVCFCGKESVNGKDEEEGGTREVSVVFGKISVRVLALLGGMRRVVEKRW